MRAADLLFEKRLLVDDDLILEVPERPYLVRPGVTQFVLVRPLDARFEREPGEPFAVIGLEPTGNLYWHATTEAEWAVVGTRPGAVRGENYVSAGPRWNGVVTLQASPAGGPAVLGYSMGVRVHHFFQTILEPGEADSAADVLGVQVVVRILRPQTGIAPVDDPTDALSSEEFSVDELPVASPPRAQPVGTRTAPLPTTPDQMRQNKTILNAILLTRQTRLRLDSGVVVDLPRVQLSFYEYRRERAPYLYIQALDNAFDPIARDDPEYGRVILVFCLRNYTMLHYEWMTEGGWDDIYEDPASVRDGTVVLSNYNERESASLPLEIVTPLAPDMRVVMRLALDVRVDPDADRPHLAPATLYFPAALERERDSAARARRKSRGLPRHHTRVLVSARRPAGIYTLGSLGTILPVMHAYAERTLDEWLERVQDALRPTGIGATTKLAKLAAAYKVDAGTYAMVFTNGEHYVVSPFAFHATIAISQTPMVRVGDAWVERGHAANLRREGDVLALPPPIGEIRPGAGPPEGKRLRTGAPAGAMVAWESMLREALAARVGDLAPLLDMLAVGAVRDDGTCLLVAADGERRRVAPAVYYAVFLYPAESLDPFVETTVAWIKDSMRAEMETRDGRILSFPAPVGEIETRAWAGKRRRA